MEVQLHEFLTSASDAGKRWNPHPRHLTYGHPLNTSWSGPQRYCEHFGEEKDPLTSTGIKPRPWAIKLTAKALYWLRGPGCPTLKVSTSVLMLKTGLAALAQTAALRKTSWYHGAEKRQKHQQLHNEATATLYAWWTETNGEVEYSFAYPQHLWTASISPRSCNSRAKSKRTVQGVDQRVENLHPEPNVVRLMRWTAYVTCTGWKKTRLRMECPVT